MVDNFAHRNEAVVYSAIFVLALAVRLLMLGNFPLREAEASWAYQAWEWGQGMDTGGGYDSAYLSLTRGLFAIFGTSNFLARLWPALVGSLVVWLPFIVREEVGNLPSIIMGLGLALDPGLIVVSRSVGSPSTGMTFLLLGLGLMAKRKYRWAAVFAGMFFLSGKGMGTGLFIAGGTLFLSHVAGVMEGGNGFLGPGGQKVREHPPIPWVDMGWILLGTVVVVGSHLLTHLQGLTAWLGAIPAFLRGWTEPFPLSRARLLVVLVVYQPLPLVFGVIEGIRGWRKQEGLSQVLSLWSGWAFLVVILYPGRQVWDLVWVIVPLCGLAGRALARVFQTRKVSAVPWILAGLFFVLSSLLWFSFTGLSIQGGNQKTVLLQWGMILATFVLGVLSVIIVAVEWAWEEAKLGAVIGIVGAMGLFMVSGLNTAAYTKVDDPRQLWLPEPATGQVSLLIDSLQEVSVYQTGREDSIEIAVLKDSSALKWALRDFPNVSYQRVRSQSLEADVIITDEEQTPELVADGYIGQDFIFQSYSGWRGGLPEDWKAWIAARSGPVERSRIILWVKRDVYPGGESFRNFDVGGPSETTDG